MATWKKVIVSGSSANLANLQVDSLSSGLVTGASGNLTTTAINGTGNIVATTNATGLDHSGSFSGSFQGDGSGLTGVTIDSLSNSLINGNGIATLSFNGSSQESVTVQADTTTGGDTKPVSVGANGVGFDVSAIAGDALSTDGDGVIDGDELNDGTDPLDICDFILTSQSVTPSSDWNDLDCDGDGVINDQEILDGTDPTDPCDFNPESQDQSIFSDEWLQLDCDGDGIPNGDEIADNDDDGNQDYDEVNNGDPNSEDGLDVFDILTPNGDGLNDVFVIRGIHNYPSNTVQVYNRWGVKVFEVQGYGVDGNKYFRGYSDGRTTIDKGDKLPAGTYYYIIDYINSEGINKQKAGPLYINRR